MLTYSSNFTLPPPSAAAAVDNTNVPDSSNYSTILAAMIPLAAVCFVVGIALLLYRYYRRTSGPVWIPKVLMK